MNTTNEELLRNGLFPMNAQKPIGKKLKSVLADEAYQVEIKWDGYRQIAIDGELLSRAINTKGVQSCKTEWVPHITGTLKQLKGYIFDGELLHYPLGTSYDVTKIMGSTAQRALDLQEANENKLTYMLFDCLATPEDGPITNKPYWFRRDRLERAYKQYLAGNPWIRLSVRYPHSELTALRQQASVEGYEGLMLKNVNSPYKVGTRTTDSRPANHWYKLKFKRANEEDCVILGYVPPEQYYKDETGKVDKSRTTRLWDNNWIGGIRIGQYINGTLTEVGSVAGLTDDMRRELSTNGQRYIGKVITISAYTRNESGHYKSPTLIGLRSDKKPIECVPSGNTQREEVTGNGTIQTRQDKAADGVE